MRAGTLFVLLLGMTVGLTALAREWPAKALSDHDRGKELYIRHCLACHGLKAKGDGLMVPALRVSVPDLSEGFGKRPMDDLVRVVMHGKGPMPSFDSAFTKEDAERVLKYLGALGGSGELATPTEKPQPEPEEPDDVEIGG